MPAGPFSLHCLSLFKLPPDSCAGGRPSIQNLMAPGLYVPGYLVSGLGSALPYGRANNPKKPNEMIVSNARATCVARARLVKASLIAERPILLLGRPEINMKTGGPGGGRTR